MVSRGTVDLDPEVQTMGQTCGSGLESAEGLPLTGFALGIWRDGPCVEIPWEAATARPELRWILDGSFAMRCIHDGRRRRNVFLVPLPEWLARVADG
jgi:hypothetical protein